MKNILIDVSRAIIENAGIARYTQKITENLVKNDRNNSYHLFATFWRNDPTKASKIKELEKYSKVNIKYIPGATKEYLWRTGKGFFLNRWYKKFDIFFAPSFMELPKFISIPSVLVIHDLTTVRFPEQRGEEVSTRLSAQMKMACDKANKIIAISKQTKNDLIEFFKIDPQKIEVVYPGIDDHFRNLCLKRDKFILSVGTLEPRKNLPNLIRSYCQLPQNIIDEYKLKIVGGVGWNDKEIYSAISKAKYKKQIELLGFVSDINLIKLYNRATLFVYPSIFEGFGLPVAEAMACGAPVITTNVSSLPEVGGDGAIYIQDPNNIKELAKTIANTLNDSKLLNKMSQLALINAKRFSWDHAAKQTIQIFEDLKGVHND